MHRGLDHDPDQVRIKVIWGKCGHQGREEGEGDCGLETKGSLSCLCGQCGSREAGLGRFWLVLGCSAPRGSPHADLLGRVSLQKWRPAPKGA